MQPPLHIRTRGLRIRGRFHGRSGVIRSEPHCDMYHSTMEYILTHVGLPWHRCESCEYGALSKHEDKIKGM